MIRANFSLNYFRDLLGLDLFNTFFIKFLFLRHSAKKEKRGSFYFDLVFVFFRCSRSCLRGHEVRPR